MLNFFFLYVCYNWNGESKVWWVDLTFSLVLCSVVVAFFVLLMLLVFWDKIDWGNDAALFC